MKYYVLKFVRKSHSLYGNYYKHFMKDVNKVKLTAKLREAMMFINKKDAEVLRDEVHKQKFGPYKVIGVHFI